MLASTLHPYWLHMLASTLHPYWLHMLASTLHPYWLHMLASSAFFIISRSCCVMYMTCGEVCATCCDATSSEEAGLALCVLQQGDRGDNMRSKRQPEKGWTGMYSKALRIRDLTSIVRVCARVRVYICARAGAAHLYRSRSAPPSALVDAAISSAPNQRK
jgi:hypothetical protein